MGQELTIGVVLRPQGINGEMKIEPYTDDAERFESLKRVLIDGTEYAVTRASVRVNGIFISLGGVNDRNSAELFRGKELKISRTEAVKLPEGRYFIADLIGCEVIFADGEKIGVLKQVFQHGAADVYEIRTNDKSVMFPALKTTLLSVDVGKKTIVVDRESFEQTAVYND